MSARPLPVGFSKLMRKLEHWELLHLREHVEELRAALEQAEAERDAALQRALWAEDSADMWREDALNVINESGYEVGLTVDGHIVAVSDPANAHSEVSA